MKRQAAAVITTAVMFVAALGVSHAQSGRTVSGVTSGGQVRQTKPAVKPRTLLKVSSGGVFLSVTDVPGTSTVTGHEDEIDVLSFSCGIVSPRDATTGAATGRHRHDPFVVTKRVDRASPSLINALITNRRLARVEISFQRGEGVAYWIRLTNASLISLKQHTPDSGGSTLLEELGFSAERIEWHWTDAGGEVLASDDPSGRT